MPIVLKTGLLIGGLCAAWTFVMGFTGWYKNPALVPAFFLVIPIEIGLLVWGLRQTAGANPYGRQVLTGTGMAAVGAVVIFFGSLLFTTTVFPNYFAELEQMQREMLRAAGKSEAEIAAAVAAAAKTQTPLLQALFGVIGTIGTGALASLVIAAFARKRS